jgi:hypothetical protein
MKSIGFTGFLHPIRTEFTQSEFLARSSFTKGA